MTTQQTTVQIYLSKTDYFACYDLVDNARDFIWKRVSRSSTFLIHLYAWRKAICFLLGTTFLKRKFFGNAFPLCLVKNAMRASFLSCLTNVTFSSPMLLFPVQCYFFLSNVTFSCPMLLFLSNVTFPVRCYFSCPKLRSCQVSLMSFKCFYFLSDVTVFFF